MTILDYRGTKIELAKYTLGLADRIDDVGNERDFHKKAQDMYEVMSDVIGDSLSEIVQGDSYDTCDLTILVDLFNESNHAYEMDIRRFEREQEKANQEMLDKLANQTALFNKAIKSANNNI